MIIDTLAHAAPYKLLSLRIAQGLAWLEQFEPSTVDRRYDLDGDNLYALVQSYVTVSMEQKQYESHRRYLDLQYVAAGLENMYYAPTSILAPATDYQAENDYLL